MMTAFKASRIAVPPTKTARAISQLCTVSPK
jgi:hypothetical protein